MVAFGLYPPLLLTDPSLATVTYQHVGGRLVAVQQQQQGIALQRRIAGTVREVNTSTPSDTSYINSGSGRQGNVRSIQQSQSRKVTSVWAENGLVRG